VYGDGQQQYDWIHVEDHCRALDAMLRRGRVGEVHNIGAGTPRANLDVLHLLLTLACKEESVIEYVKDRPGHDRRYALRCDKISNEIGGKPVESFEQGIRKTVEWYRRNPEWVAHVRGGDYRHYYARHYERRDETVAVKRRLAVHGAFSAISSKVL